MTDQEHINLDDAEFMNLGDASEVTEGLPGVGSEIFNSRSPNDPPE